MGALYCVITKEAGGGEKTKLLGLPRMFQKLETPTHPHARFRIHSAT